MLTKMISRMRGTSLTEMLIITPVFLMLTLGAFQYSLIYEAKSSLDYATFMAARAGATGHANQKIITMGLAKSIAPLYSPDAKVAGLLKTIAKARIDVGLYSKIKIINPTKEAFKDFGVKNKKNNKLEIPNEMLHLSSTSLGAKSKVNIQDANLLKLQVLYGYKLKVPFVNSVITKVSSWFTKDPTKLAYLKLNRLPILATATVRMQSSAWDNSWVAKIADVDKAVSDSAKPATPLVLSSLKRPWASGPTGQGNPSLGLPNNSSNGNTGSNNPAKPGNGPDGKTGNNGDNKSNSSNPDKTVKCKTKWSDARYQSPPVVWYNPVSWAGPIRAAAAVIVDFFSGLIKGAADQLKGLIDLIKNPGVLLDLAKAFISDPKGTIKALVEAVGGDLKKIAECGPKDIGLVIGQNISPAAGIKIIAKLAKITRNKKLAELANRKKNKKCASFTASTPVWTPDGRVSIRNLLKGGLVKSRDESSLKNSDQKITDLHGRIAEGYHRIQTEAGVIEVTAEHPFWVQGKGWVEAKNLEWEDPIATVNGDAVMYQNEYVNKPIRVYNFTVNSTHNYFAGSMGAWVHNAVVCAVTGADLPEVKKAVNSNLPHASARSVERGVFPDAKSANAALKDLTKKISKDGFPEGSILDTANANRVLVPVGNNGLAVYQVGKNGTAKLNTILIAN